MTEGNQEKNTLERFLSSDTDQTPEIDGYRVSALLASGGMGDVYSAIQKGVERRVAIKVAKGLVSVDARMQQRFMSEARALGKLDHPNVVRVIEVGQLTSTKSPFMVMEFVGDGSLRDHIRRSCLPMQTVKSIMMQLCSALECIHNAGLVHRDIKPENILLSNNGRVWLADFGIVAETDGERITTDERSPLTRGYASPEQHMGRQVDGRSDIYSAGVLLLELLSAEIPDADLSAIDSLEENFAPWKDVISRATAFDVKDRFASISDFASAVDACTVVGKTLERKAEVEIATIGDQVATTQPSSVDSELVSVQASKGLIIGTATLILLSVGLGVTALVFALNDNGKPGEDQKNELRAESPPAASPTEAKGNVEYIADFDNGIDESEFLLISPGENAIECKNGRLKIGKLNAIATAQRVAPSVQRSVLVSVDFSLHGHDSLWIGIRSDTSLKELTPERTHKLAEQRFLEFRREFRILNYDKEGEEVRFFGTYATRSDRIPFTLTPNGKLLKDGEFYERFSPEFFENPDLLSRETYVPPRHELSNGLPDLWNPFVGRSLRVCISAKSLSAYEVLEHGTFRLGKPMKVRAHGLVFPKIAKSSMFRVWERNLWSDQKWCHWRRGTTPVRRLVAA